MYTAEAPQIASASLGDRQWPEIFRDEGLQRLIETALQHNYDVRIAAARILQAEAQGAAYQPLSARGHLLRTESYKRG